MSTMTGYPDAKVSAAPQQFLALDRLGNAQGQTQLLLDELTEKLAPVLNNSRPTNDRGPSEASEIETAVHSAATTAEQINSRLRSILDRIDI